MFVAKVLQELHEGLLALPLDPNEDRSSGPDSWDAALHRASTNSRNATQNARSVLGIESDVTAEPLHVLSAVQSSRAVLRLLKYENLFFLQVVQ